MSAVLQTASRAETGTETASYLAALGTAWPDHAATVQRTVGASPELDRTRESVASFIRNVAGIEPAALVGDYRFTCDALHEEEVHFLRHGTYRLQGRAGEAAHHYADDAFMSRYMAGLLASHLFWWNHTSVIRDFDTEYLPRLPSGTRHLEIGPGHGLLFRHAATAPAVASLEAWDLSATSLESTRKAVAGIAKPSVFRLQSAADGTVGAAFDSVTVSEVLEHVDDPAAVLSAIRATLAPGGRAFINVPVNSPAPDHVFLFARPDACTELVRRCGFSVEWSAAYPMNQYSLTKAARLRATVSCVLLARRED